MDPTPRPREPLPIWFFVGVILSVYGVLVMVGGMQTQTRPTVLSETRPALWWGAILCVFGAVFTTIGWLGRDKAE